MAATLEGSALALLDAIARKSYSAKKNLQEHQQLPPAGTFAELGALMTALELRLALKEAKGREHGRRTE